MTETHQRARLWTERVMNGCLSAFIDPQELSQAFVHFAIGSARDRLIALAVPHAVLNTDLSLYIGGKRWLPLKIAHTVTTGIDPDADEETVARIHRISAGIDCVAWAKRLDLRVVLLSESAMVQTPMDVALLLAAEQALADKDTTFLHRCCDAASMKTAGGIDDTSDESAGRRRDRVLERFARGTATNTPSVVTTVLLGAASPPCLLSGIAELNGVETLCMAGFSSPLSDVTLDIVHDIHCMRKLQHLNLTGTELTMKVMDALFPVFPSRLASFPLLTKLWLGRVSRRADFSRYLATDGVLPSLTDLRIDFCEADEEFLSALAQRPLKRLHLESIGTAEGSYASWSAVHDVPLARSLSHLLLDGVVDGALAHLGSFRALTALALRSSRVTNEALALFLCAQSSLRSLEIVDGTPLELPPRPVGADVASLTTLSLRNTRSDVASLVPWFRATLRSLDLRSSTTTDDEAVNTAVRSFPHLQELDVRWCSKLTPLFFAPVAEASPNLRIRQTVIDPRHVLPYVSRDPCLSARQLQALLL